MGRLDVMLKIHSTYHGTTDDSCQSYPNQGTNDQKGPLAHLRVIELAGLAPVPYCGLILKQFGADVIHVQRNGPQPEDPAGLGLVSVNKI